MLLFSIISACLLATVIAIVTAYSLNGRILDRWGAGLSCVSTGLLLTLAFTHLLPEAFEHAADPRHIGIALWAACVLLFRSASPQPRLREADRRLSPDPRSVADRDR